MLNVYQYEDEIDDEQRPQDIFLLSFNKTLRQRSCFIGKNFRDDEFLNTEQIRLQFSSCTAAVKSASPWFLVVVTVMMIKTRLIWLQIFRNQVQCAYETTMTK